MAEQLELLIVYGRDISLGEAGENYNSDADIASSRGGEEGHDLATAILQNEEMERLFKEHQFRHLDSKYLDGLKIVKEKTGEIEGSLDCWGVYQSIVKRRDKGFKGIRRIFEDLEKAGYNLAHYSKMKKDNSLAYLRKIRKDIGEKLFDLNYRLDFLNRDFS